MQSRAEQLLDEGRYQEALEHFESGNDLRSVFGRGVALQLLGRFDEAEEAYETVLAADPVHQETLANLLAMSVEEFDLKAVERYAKRLLDLDSTSAVALRGLIVVAVERHDYEFAAICFAKLTLRDEHFRDAIEYRLSRQIVDRLKDIHGQVTHSY
jgi:tetratricopeptide (TPR) repeat protein